MLETLPPPEEFLDLVWVGPHAWAEIISREKSLERYIKTTYWVRNNT